MKQNRIKREPDSKQCLAVKVMYCNEETPFCLMSQALI